MLKCPLGGGGGGGYSSKSLVGILIREDFPRP